MKKILSITLVVVLLAGIAVSGTMAYLQDSDSDVNVMTLGNVKIEQHELQRDAGVAHKGILKENDLVKFAQDKPIYPAVPAVGKDSPYTAEPDELLYWGPYVTAEGAGNGLWNDNKISNVRDKFVFVENTGKSDAYYRTIIAFECPEGMEYSQGSDKEFMMNVNGIDKFDWSTEGFYVMVNEVRYLVNVAIYAEALKPGEISRPSLLQVLLTENATNEDMELLGDEYKIIVVSQAVQTTGFDNAAAALDEAFGKVSKDNEAEVIKWLAGADDEAGSPTAPANNKVVYNGTEYNNIYDAIAAANANGGGEIKLMGSATLDKSVEIAANITINGNVDGKSAAFTRADDYTGTMFTVKTGATLTAEGVVLDGAGATATGNLIATEGNGSIVLNAGTILQNNNGAHAVSLATRGGGTLTLNGAKIINNSSDSGAIWGGGHIIVNENSQINNNSSTGSAGAIRMVSSCNLTMNGGEICNNKAATDGGAIWGYGSSTYTFKGGKMSGNESAGTGGAIYTGTYSVINISGDFEMCDNKAANSGAIRLTDHTSMTMTGGKVSGNTQNGESNAFNTWNNTISITGGTLADNMSYVGGLGLTIGAADIDGVIAYNLATNHNTAYLAEDFKAFKFTVNESADNFDKFNFEPAAGYTYTAGDEAKLICMNAGYETYWDAATGTFKLKAI